MVARAILTDPVVIDITGEPVAWSRTRIAILNGRPVPFTAIKYRRWQTDARMVARQVMARRQLLTGCLALAVNVSFVPPTTWAKWKRQAALDGLIEHTGKPDLSNILKAAEDALTGVVFLDDAQVVSIEAAKLYAGSPRVWIQVTPQQSSPSQITRKSDLADIEARIVGIVGRGGLDADSF